MRKSTKLPHRKRGKSNRYRARLRAKHQRVRRRRTHGARKHYR